MFADGPTTASLDVLGGIGWGSFGLTGLLLGWLLLKYLPSKDEQIERFFALLIEQRNRFELQLEKQQEHFTERNNAIIKVIDNNREVIMRLWELKFAPESKPPEGRPPEHGGRGSGTL